MDIPKKIWKRIIVGQCTAYWTRKVSYRSIECLYQTRDLICCEDRFDREVITFRIICNHCAWFTDPIFISDVQCAERQS